MRRGKGTPPFRPSPAPPLPAARPLAFFPPRRTEASSGDASGGGQEEGDAHPLEEMKRLERGRRILTDCAAPAPKPHRPRLRSTRAPARRILTDSGAAKRRLRIDPESATPTRPAGPAHPPWTRPTKTPASSFADSAITAARTCATRSADGLRQYPGQPECDRGTGTQRSTSPVSRKTYSRPSSSCTWASSKRPSKSRSMASTFTHAPF